MGPQYVAPGSGILPLLSTLIPIVAIAIVLLAMPPVRRAVTGRFTGARAYFYGPTVTAAAVEDGDASVDDLPVETPDWLSMDLYNETVDDPDAADDPAQPDGPAAADPEQGGAGDPDETTSDDDGDIKEPVDPFEALYGAAQS